MKRMIVYSLFLLGVLVPAVGLAQPPSKTLYLRELSDPFDTKVPLRFSIQNGEKYDYKIVSLAEYVNANLKVNLADAGYVLVTGSVAGGAPELSGSVALDTPQYIQGLCKPRIKWFDFLTGGVTYFGEYALPPDWRTRELVCAEIHVVQKLKADLEFNFSGEPVHKEIIEELRVKKSQESDLIKSLSLKMASSILKNLKEIEKAQPK